MSKRTWTSTQCSQLQRSTRFKFPLPHLMSKPLRSAQQGRVGGNGFRVTPQDCRSANVHYTPRRPRPQESGLPSLLSPSPFPRPPPQHTHTYTPRGGGGGDELRTLPQCTSPFSILILTSFQYLTLEASLNLLPNLIMNKNAEQTASPTKATLMKQFW